MNILFVSPYIPFPMNRGAKLRTASLLHALRSHNVTFWALDQGGHGDIDQLTRYVSDYELINHTNVLATGLSGKIMGWLRAMLQLLPTPVISERNQKLMTMAKETAAKQEAIDFLFVEFPWMMPYTIPFRGKAKIVLDCHNVESDGFRKSHSKFWWPIWRIWRRFERWAVTNADIILVTSAEEKQRFEQLHPKGCFIVVPNSIDTSRYKKHNYVNRKGIVFTGSLDYLPNIQAVELLANDVLPLIQIKYPQVQLEVVGYNPPRKIIELGRRDGITIHANVPEIEPYIAAAKLSIVPITSGAGTRLKILEAFALGTPVVSTEFGAEGIEAGNRQEILLSPTPVGLAERVIELLGDEIMGEKLSYAAKKLVDTKYSWQRVEQVMEEVLEQ